MTKSESKYFNTAKIMDEALIYLLGKKELQYITVKEICEKAGVNRSTFYLHYETINDLLLEAVDYIQEEFLNSFTDDDKDFLNNIEKMELGELIFINDKYLLPYLKFVKEHKHVYKAIVNNPESLQTKTGLAGLNKYILKPIFTRFNIPETEQKYWIAYHIQGIMAIVFKWLENGCLESDEKIAKIIENCVRPGKQV